MTRELLWITELNALDCIVVPSPEMLPSLSGKKALDLRRSAIEVRLVLLLSSSDSEILLVVLLSNFLLVSL